MSFALRAKIIISFPQNSLETQDLQVLLFALPPCAKSSRVLGERFLLDSEGVLSLVSWTRPSEEAFRENIWDGPFTVRKAETSKPSLRAIAHIEKDVGDFSPPRIKVAQACLDLLQLAQAVEKEQQLKASTVTSLSGRPVLSRHFFHFHEELGKNTKGLPFSFQSSCEDTKLMS